MTSWDTRVRIRQGTLRGERLKATTGEVAPNDLPEKTSTRFSWAHPLGLVIRSSSMGSGTTLVAAKRLRQGALPWGR